VTVDLSSSQTSSHMDCISCTLCLSFACFEIALEAQVQVAQFELSSICQEHPHMSAGHAVAGSEAIFSKTTEELRHNVQLKGNYISCAPTAGTRP